ncbi:MAG TPA: hypothetical protein VFP97_14735 [Chitinophagaceae bacterium]|nr:hypothetical protein [Chitinophagaceae bacterium]
MKKTFKNFLIIVSLFAAVPLIAQDDKVDKEKKERQRYEFFRERNISKTYPAAGNTLHIDNRFGKVKVITWDKSEIKVDIHIETSSTHKDLADKTFERIDVEDKQDGKNIYFKTIHDKNKTKENMSCTNCSNTMSVDYTIQMPSGNPLNIENSFGGIEIPDYNGPVSIKSKYGHLTAGKLAKPQDVSVEFGKADIKSIGNTDLEFKYSAINIDNLTGNCKLKMSFCSYSRINLDNNLTGLTIHDSYSAVHLDPAPNLSATYSIQISYGSVIDKTSIGIKRTDTREKYGPDLTGHYEGKSGSGNAKIDIKSSFGNIMIGKGTKEDMKEKKKVRS